MKFTNLVYVMELFSLSVVCCLYRLRRQQSQTFLHNVCRRTNVDRLITRWLAQRNEKDGTLSFFTKQTADRFRPLGSRVQRTVQLQQPCHMAQVSQKCNRSKWVFSCVGKAKRGVVNSTYFLKNFGTCMYPRFSKGNLPRSWLIDYVGLPYSSFDAVLRVQ